MVLGWVPGTPIDHEYLDFRNPLTRYRNQWESLPGVDVFSLGLGVCIFSIGGSWTVNSLVIVAVVVVAVVVQVRVAVVVAAVAVVSDHEFLVQRVRKLEILQNLSECRP